jgi:phosphoadenosine phosphosulfate reductase
MYLCSFKFGSMELVKENAFLNQIDSLNQKFTNSTAQEILQYFLMEYKGRAALSSSLGAEDQVLTDIIVRIDKNTRIFTLDTGRLFPETYDLIDLTNSRYKIQMEVFFPDYQEVQKMIHERGINLFYKSIENRKLCCHIRKIEPLQRAFSGVKVWITGLRREQSVTRQNGSAVEWDEGNKLIKINPLINWTEKEVWDYIHSHQVPYNKLHDQGFPSIGCQPCTRAIKPGEDVRAGRWWWEMPEYKECGLHKNGD